MVAHKNRPVDVISFLGNEVWIIDDTGNGDVNNDYAGAPKVNDTNQLLGSEDKDDNDDNFCVELSISKTTSRNKPEIEMQEKVNIEKELKHNSEEDEDMGLLEIFT